MQKKKNSRSYKRTLTYLFLQKLCCPICGRILAGKATTKKNGNTYYYYYCHDCKITIKEDYIVDYFDNFIEEIVEYDNVVNQTLLPMIKTKLNNPKEDLENSLKEQKAKYDRIKQAYINGTFSLVEYDTEKEIVEKEIEKLEFKIKNCEICDDLSFTPEDILIKRDIDYINQILYPEEYEERTYFWKDYIREEKADLIMRYVDKITLTKVNKNDYKVDEIFFRESMCKPCNELYDAGYIDKKDFALIGNVVTKLRFSEYLPFEKVSEHIFRLRDFYDVGYFEATYYYNNKVMFFNGWEKRRIVRIFPLEDYKKLDKIEQLKLGVIYVNKGDKTLLDNVDDVFEYLPEHGITSRTFELDEETKKRKEEMMKHNN